MSPFKTRVYVLLGFAAAIVIFSIGYECGGKSLLDAAVQSSNECKGLTL